MQTNKLRGTAFLMMLLILCGAVGLTATADTPWNVRAGLTREGTQGEMIVNEALVQLAQEVNQTVSGDYVRITVSDALFDGKSLIAAWEVENLSGEQLVYLMGAVAEDGVNWAGGLLIGGPTEEFVMPGQTRNEFMDCEIVDLTEEDTMRVGIRYYVLAPTEETVALEYPDPTEEGYAQKQQTFDMEVKAIADEGKMVIATAGGAQPRFMDEGPSIFEEMSQQYELLGGECTPVEAMIGTGRLKLLEELEVSFDLEVTHQLASMLPNGEPVEREYEGYTMRVTRADYTIGTMEIILEAVFDNAESVKQFGAENCSFVALDENGQLLRDGGLSSWGTTGVEEERDDGTRVVEYCILHRELFTLPEAVTVCPVPTRMLSGGESPGPVEGVVLAIRQ